jgi:hypothetical protein
MYPNSVRTPAPDRLDNILVPVDPQGALICRYTPLGGVENKSLPHGKLYRSVRLARASARELAMDADQIPRGSATGTFSCPADFGQYDLLIFSYRTTSDVDLIVSRSGCRVFSNGYTTRIGIGVDAAHKVHAFVAALDRLAGPLYRQPGL